MSTPFSVRDAKNTILKLQDVKTTGLANGEVLVYNSISKLWENGSAGGGGGTEIVATDNLRSLNAGTPTGTGNILLGKDAGSANLASNGLVCIGMNALPVATTNISDTVVIGENAGLVSVRTNRNVLIGSEVVSNLSTANISQTQDGVVIGYDAGGTRIGRSVVIGSETNRIGHSELSVILGDSAALSSQSARDVIIGGLAKSANSGAPDNENVIIGYEAGRRHAGTRNVMIGSIAGEGTGNYTCRHSVLVGQGAGGLRGRDELTAVGQGAGYSNAGVNCTYLGRSAGVDGGNHDNTLVLNAQTGALNPTQANSCFIKPIRYNNVVADALFYNSTSGEVTYQPVIATQYSLDANLTNPTSTFTNWVTQTGTLQANLGTPVTVLSGSFAFPATGYYKIEMTIAVDNITGGNVRLVSTDDNFATQDIIAQVFAYDNGGSGIDCANTISTIVNITDIANDKVRIIPFGVSGIIRGGTADVRTSILFIKLS
jgi:hypothetical protein